jgi:ABC-type nitrate/sulfonate/bicarbonate transport system permease component
MDSHTLGILPVQAPLLVWQWVATAVVYPVVLLPRCWRWRKRLSREPVEIFGHILASLSRVALGVSAAFCVAAMLGSLIDRYR